MTMMRSRWAAMGAAVAVTLGGGGVALVSATAPAGAVTFVQITACRVLDTRPGADNVGPRDTPLGADETHVVDAISAGSAAGNCAGVIPADATAIDMNMTAVDATQLTFLTVWDGSTPRPLASSLNPAAGQPPTPNAVTTELAAGEFSIYNLTGTVHVLADVTGYYVDHTHDDRYYTRQQVDDALGSKADARDTYTETEVDVLLDAKADERTTYTEQEVDDLLAAQRPIAVSAADTLIPDIAGGSPVSLLLAPLDAPGPGLLQVTASTYWYPAAGSTEDFATCYVTVDGSTLVGSIRTVGIPGSCSTNGGIELGAGSYNVRLVGIAGDAVTTEGATIDLLFIPD